MNSTVKRSPRDMTRMAFGTEIFDVPNFHCPECGEELTIQAHTHYVRYKGGEYVPLFVCPVCGIRMDLSVHFAPSIATICLNSYWWVADPPKEKPKEEPDIESLASLAGDFKNLMDGLDVAMSKLSALMKDHHQ